MSDYSSDSDSDSVHSTASGQEVFIEMVSGGGESKESPPPPTMQPKKTAARANIVQRMRNDHQESTGHMTVSERREQRRKAKMSTLNQAKNIAHNFWTGHRQGRFISAPQGHPPTKNESKEEHVADYSRFLETKFTPDVMYKGEDKPHISSLRARVRQALRSPRMVVDIEEEDSDHGAEPCYNSKTGVVVFHNKRYTPYSLCGGSGLGTHKLFHCRCCVQVGTGSEFEVYGLGVVLWFKYVKWMGIIFFGLCLLALPQWSIFGSSGKLAGELDSESKLHVLAQLGMANMG